MGTTDYNHYRNPKRIETMVLSVYSFYTIAMFIMAQLSGWSIVVKEIIFLTLISSWIVSMNQYGTVPFRAVVITVMAWINMILYAVNTDHYIAMLSTMAGLIVLLGIFCITRIVYMEAVFVTVILFYYFFLSGSVALETSIDKISLVLQVISIYTVLFVTWLLIRIQGQTNEQLIENIEDLKRAEQSKDDFMANVSHEIRTPINIVCGMSEAMLQDELSPDVRKDIMDIQTAGQNLLSIISDILDFSELETGELALVEENYNLNSVLTDILNMVLARYMDREVELVVDCEADLPSGLVGDEQKLRRILFNLLGNALKFTVEGGVVLSVSARKTDYGINLIVSVKDSGIGIAPDKIENIFTRFHQADAKRNRENGGVGLGLPISKALVRKMGGFINVRSVLGEGSDFQFVIPQKVMDDTPLVSIRNREDIYAAFYVNMHKYNCSVVKEGYEKVLSHISGLLDRSVQMYKSLGDLKTAVSRETFSHIFIGWQEYCEDRGFFDSLLKETLVAVTYEEGQEQEIPEGFLRICKPVTIFGVAALLNYQKMSFGGQNETGEKRQRFTAPQAKVLVVDDSRMNLKVMARHLAAYKIQVTQATSGQQALDLLGQTEFDCVFLDHMMPEMDGVQTLNKLRSKAGSYFRTVPVIAFTANAIGNAREMFLAEGFDDFLAKPIELGALDRILKRYIPAEKQLRKEQADVEEPAEEIKIPEEEMHSTKQEENPEPVEEKEPYSSMKAAGIDIQRGMTFCGDEEGYKEIAGMFYEDGEGKIGAFDQSLAEKDWKNYVILAHSLKSNSNFLGASHLAETAKQMEAAAKKEDEEWIRQNHQKLLAEYKVVLQAIKEDPAIAGSGQQKKES